MQVIRAIVQTSCNQINASEIEHHLRQIESTIPTITTAASDYLRTINLSFIEIKNKTSELLLEEKDRSLLNQLIDKAIYDSIILATQNSDSHTNHNMAINQFAPMLNMWTVTQNATQELIRHQRYEMERMITSNKKYNQQLEKRLHDSEKRAERALKLNLIYDAIKLCEECCLKGQKTSFRSQGYARIMNSMTFLYSKKTVKALIEIIEIAKKERAKVAHVITTPLADDVHLKDIKEAVAVELADDLTQQQQALLFQLFDWMEKQFIEWNKTNLPKDPEDCITVAHDDQEGSISAWSEMVATKK